MVNENRNNERLRKQAADASALLQARKQAQAGNQASRPDTRPPRKPGQSNFIRFISRNLTYILSVAAVVCLVALGLIIAAFIIGFPDNNGANSEEAYVSPYDWEKLDRTDGRFAYVSDGTVKSRLGIDVSENQHLIDWDAVAQDGIDFAIIRLGYRGATAGDLYLDEYFWNNLEGAKNAGLDVGVYFFSQAQNVEEAREEAEFVLDHLDGFELDYPIAFDSEEKVLGIAQSRTKGLDDVQMTAIAQAFCDRVETAGYDSIIYGNANDLSRYNRADLKNDRIWWAEYNMPSPTAKIDMVMWQYSNVGKVDGIDADVDMNIDLTHALD